MNSSDYKARCADVDVFSRAALEATVRALSMRDTPKDLIPRINAILAGPVIPKPELHRERQSGETDYFSVKGLSPDEAAFIADVFLDLEVASVDPRGEITGNGGHYAALVDCWNNYARRWDDPDDLG